jgi:hypothetical protein
MRPLPVMALVLKWAGLALCAGVALAGIYAFLGPEIGWTG